MRAWGGASGLAGWICGFGPWGFGMQPPAQVRRDADSGFRRPGWGARSWCVTTLGQGRRASGQGRRASGQAPGQREPGAARAELRAPAPALLHDPDKRSSWNLPGPHARSPQRAAPGFIRPQPPRPRLHPTRPTRRQARPRPQRRSSSARFRQERRHIPPAPPYSTDPQDPNGGNTPGVPRSDGATPFSHTERHPFYNKLTYPAPSIPTWEPRPSTPAGPHERSRPGSRGSPPTGARVD
jgi:hypothetical protein